MISEKDSKASQQFNANFPKERQINWPFGLGNRKICSCHPDLTSARIIVLLCCNGKRQLLKMLRSEVGNEGRCDHLNKPGAGLRCTCRIANPFPRDVEFAELRSL
jgi:hypothetical protein